MSDLSKRLETFLRRQPARAVLARLTPDASTREYFRIRWEEGTAVACVYPEPFVESEQTYLDVTSLFLRCGLPVAKILAVDEALGVIVIEDLGETILRDVLMISGADEKDRLLNEAIRLIVRIQAATDMAYETGSIASRLKFDQEKLLWELDFFKTHYFGTFRGSRLGSEDERKITSEFEVLSDELEQRARVLCHRDFHAANLMISPEGTLKIIDHQDARIGTHSYDLVSLLLDRVTEPPPSEWLDKKLRYFLAERVRAGLEEIDLNEFASEFHLQAVQRCLKAVGTFSFQAANRGKQHFVQFIRPMFQIVISAAETAGRFPILRELLGREV